MSGPSQGQTQGQARGQTQVQKLMARQVGRERVAVGEIVTARPDRVMSHDNTAFIVKEFQKTGYERVWDPERIVIVFDHCVPALDPAHQRNHAEAQDFAREQGLPHFLGAVGVCHQVMCERGYVVPGQLILGADSHSTLYGALGALGIPINRTEMAGVWATGELWLKVPPTIRIELSGRLSPGVSAKDLILRLLRDLRADGASYAALEFGGPGLASLGMSERMTLTNMAVELGAKCGLMPFDAVAQEFFARCPQRAEPQPAVADPDAQYAQVVELDLGQLDLQIACPHTVDNVRDLGDVTGTKIQQGYLGSCTNGRLEDLRIAAELLRGRQVAAGVKLVVYPASDTVLAEARAEGLIEVLEAAGAELMTASCGPCFGAVGATLEPGEVCVSSSNRNFCGRMGSREAEVYLASPAVVAASCVAGSLTDPRSLA